MNKNNDGSLNERQKKIVQILELYGDISVKELATKFHCSEMTIRRDLKKFEKTGILFRTYGGAQSSPGKRQLKYLSSDDINLNIEKKIAIAKFVVENLVQDGQNIFLDTGSTMLQIARYLSNRKRISVITNSVDIMAELYHCPEINCLIIGGSLSENSSTLYGPYAMEQLKKWESKVDISFISCDGIILQSNEGFYTKSSIDASLTPIALKTGSEKWIAADSTKIGKRTLFKFADFCDVDLFITDSGINDSQLNYLQKKVDVEVAKIIPI